MLKGIDHVAIICSNYRESKHFYTSILEFKVVHEVYREDRDSYMLNLALADGTQIELFSFPDSPERLNYPEARGLRHLAFCVENIEKAVENLRSKGVTAEKIRTNEYTGKRYTFFKDPDGLPLELCEE